MCQVQSHVEAVMMRKIHYIPRLLSIFLGLQGNNSLRGHITSFQAIMRAYYHFIGGCIFRANTPSPIPRHAPLVSHLVFALARLPFHCLR